MLAASSHLQLGSGACALHPLSPVLFPPASTRLDPPRREFEFLPWFPLVKSFPWVPLAPILSLNRSEATRSRPCRPQMPPAPPSSTPGRPSMAHQALKFLNFSAGSNFFGNCSLPCSLASAPIEGACLTGTVYNASVLHWPLRFHSSRPSSQNAMAAEDIFPVQSFSKSEM